MEPYIAGIDFGAKMAGTTAVCFSDCGTLKIVQSSVKKDADVWLKDIILTENFTHVYIDAPLSLPAAYYGRGTDFVYRKCDRVLQAMSPMFLGGLTARAMSLSHFLKSKAIHNFEVYPAAFVRSAEHLAPWYHKKQSESVPLFYRQLKSHLPFTTDIPPVNYHQTDSLICWYIGYRHLNELASAAGDASEGIILY